MILQEHVIHTGMKPRSGPEVVYKHQFLAIAGREVSTQHASPVAPLIRASAGRHPESVLIENSIF